MRHMRTALARLALGAVFASFCLLPQSAMGEPSQPPKPVAEMSIGATRVDWLPVADAERWVLSVTGPGDLFLRREFEPGQSPFLSLFDENGNRPADGIYTYELRGVPRGDREARNVPKEAPGTGSFQERALLRSGYLVIRDGGFVSAPSAEPEATGEPRSAVQPPIRQISEKQIVSENLCVGFECDTGDDDFPVLKLKDSVVGVLFEDTPYVFSPADRDWSIFVNDAFFGEGEYFAISDLDAGTVPFRIEGTAPDHSLYVRSNGNLGLGTSTPGAKLHLYASATADTFGSAGPDPASGPAFNFGYGGASFGRGAGFLNARPDASATAPNPSLRFLTANVERMIITNTGRVGIGTTGPSEMVDIFENVNANSIARIQNTNTGDTTNAAWRASSDSTNVNLVAHGSGRTITRFGVALGSRGEILHTGGNGLVIGTLEADNIILGTNNTNRLEIGGTGGVTVTGNFTATGTKNFAVVDPEDTSQAIYYAALEGPEAGTYFRGTARTKSGEAVIDLPDYFARLTEPERLTVQLTPLGSWGQLYVAEKTPSRIVVRVPPGSADLEFNYFVQGVRKGYLNYQVKRPNTLPQ